MKQESRDGMSGNPLHRPRFTIDLEGVSRGEPQAIALMLSCYQSPLYRFVYGMTRDQGMAEEVVQDVFLRVIRALKSMDIDRLSKLSLQPWLYKIALNHTRNLLRKRRIKDISLDFEIQPGEFASSSKEPGEIAQNKEFSHFLEQSLLSLPLVLRATAILYFVDDRTYAEIADLLGKPLGTVKSNVSRAARILRRVLLEHRKEESVGNVKRFMKNRRKYETTENTEEYSMFSKRISFKRYY